MGFNWEGPLHHEPARRARELARARRRAVAHLEDLDVRRRVLHQGTIAGTFYAKAQNLSRLLRKTYDDVLARYDLLAMPTLPMKATPLPPANAPLALWCQRAFEMLPNTSPFDVTGHPAMSIPCGMSAGLPIGLMLVGKHYNETTIYRAAHAFEQLGDWRNF
jgi:amidase